MSDTDHPSSGPIVHSPTGAPIIPAKYVPYVLTAASICTVVAAQFALSGPWTPERYFTVGAVVLNALVSGSLAGLRR